MEMSLGKLRELVMDRVPALVLAHPLKSYTTATEAPETHARLPRIVHCYQ